MEGESPTLTISWHTVFLTTSFLTTSISLLKSTGGVFKSPISNLSISDFKPAKSVFWANVDVSTTVAFFKSDYVA